MLGFKVPNKEFNDVLLVLKGLKKSHPHVKRAAFPITPKILREIGHVIQHDNPFQATMWSLFLTSFYLMLHKSNVCKTYGMEEIYLRQKHVHFQGKQILVNIFWMKTLQLGERVLEMPLLPVPNSDICPVKVMVQMLRLVPGGPDTPLFAYQYGKHITYPVYLRFLKEKIQ